jgi:hypothetical protein
VQGQGKVGVSADQVGMLQGQGQRRDGHDQVQAPPKPVNSRFVK